MISGSLRLKVGLAAAAALAAFGPSNRIHGPTVACAYNAIKRNYFVEQKRACQKCLVECSHKNERFLLFRFHRANTD